MTEFEPAWFYEFGYYLKPLLYLREDLPREVQVHLCTYATIGLILFDTEGSAKFLPKTRSQAAALKKELDVWSGLKKGDFGPRTNKDIPNLHDWVKSLSQTLTDELGSLHVFCVEETGGLDVNLLISGFAAAYPVDTISLLDDIIKREVNDGGRCLAFGCHTASGFHMLRAVEIVVKAYVIASSGSLPPIKQRNWGAYIDLLKNSGASEGSIDVLHVLKRKRNPLMHAQDSLDAEGAIDIFSVCRSGIRTLISDVRDRSLDVKFTAALASLATA